MTAELPPDLSAWPVGLVSAVVAALLLWPLGARLGLSPATRATAAAIYATAAVLVEVYAPTGVDGRATMLLAAAAGLAVGRWWRNVLAALLTAAAVAVAPVTAVGFLVLLAGMVTSGGLATRFRDPVRWALAAVGVAAAVALAARLVRPELPPALPPGVLGVLSVWSLLVVALIWRRMRWLRPLGWALPVILVCCWLPGPDADAVVVLAAVGGVLTAVLAEEYPGLLVRRATAVTVTGLALVAALLVPSDSRRPDDAALAAPGVAPAPDARSVAPPARAAAVRPVSITIPALGLAGPLATLSADPATGELRRRTTRTGPAGTQPAWSPGTTARPWSAGTSTRGPGPASSSAWTGYGRATRSRSSARTDGRSGSR